MMNLQNTLTFIGSIAAAALSLPMSSAVAADVPVRFFSVSVESQGEWGWSLLEDVPLHLRAGSSFAKLSLVFEAPQQLMKVEVESCSGEWRDGADFYFSPGQRRAFAENGKVILSGVVSPNHDPVRAVAVVFRNNEGGCLKNIRFFDAKGVMKLKLPKTVSAIVDGAPETLRAFDSQAGNAASLEKGTKVLFEQAQTFDRVRLLPALQEPRAKKISVAADSQKEQEIAIEPGSNESEVLLPNKLSGRRVSVRTKDEGRVGEIRFADAETVIAIKAGNRQRSADVLRGIFADAGIPAALDSQISTREESDNWQFRFRSDGSFYARGNGENPREARAFSVVGTYDAKSPGADKKIRLTLRGVKVAGSQAWDGVACYAGCGDMDRLARDFFQEVVTIEKSSAGYFTLRNQDERTERELSFQDIKTKVSTLSE